MNFIHYEVHQKSVNRLLKDIDEKLFSFDLCFPLLKSLGDFLDGLFAEFSLFAGVDNETRVNHKVEQVENDLRVLSEIKIIADTLGDELILVPSLEDFLPYQKTSC